ncbi:hypothetical protein D082_13600 [Synechocystis sp. PCC 6714]|nr:hypothetical protein D082_13600 [Synechocystis sp. PCC 6714]
MVDCLLIGLKLGVNWISDSGSLNSHVFSFTGPSPGWEPSLRGLGGLPSRSLVFCPRQFQIKYFNPQKPVLLNELKHRLNFTYFH